MPGLVVHSGMTMTCPHGGTATFVPAGPPVAFVNGVPVATAKDQIVVAGCPAQPTPCVKVQWSNIGTVLAGGTPILLQAPPPVPPPVPGNGVSLGSAAPGPPLVMAMQLLVTGT